VIIPKVPAAPRSSEKFLIAITKPLASAKSAIHQMKKKIAAMAERI
jgi:hypothetical protein